MAETEDKRTPAQKLVAQICAALYEEALTGGSPMKLETERHDTFTRYVGHRMVNGVTMYKGFDLYEDGSVKEVAFDG